MKIRFSRPVVPETLPNFHDCVTGAVYSPRNFQSSVYLCTRGKDGTLMLVDMSDGMSYDSSCFPTWVFEKVDAEVIVKG